MLTQIVLQNRGGVNRKRKNDKMRRYYEQSGKLEKIQNKVCNFVKNTIKFRVVPELKVKELTIIDFTSV